MIRTPWAGPAVTFHSFDSEYLQRLKDGDPFVEEHFASYFGQLLFLKLRSRLRSLQLIEDIRQETLLRVLQALRQKNGVEHPERFGAFVNAVCHNVMLELCRAETRHDQIDENQAEPPDSRVDLDEPLVTWERKRQIQRILAELAEKDRDLLRAVYLEQRDKSEICKRFKVDEDYLRVLVHRAKSRFRKAYVQSVGSAVN